MVKISRELETAEVFFYLNEATKMYNESFPTSSKMLDEDPVGNVITLAQYMLEAKEPTRRAILPQEVLTRLVEKKVEV